MTHSELRGRRSPRPIFSPVKPGRFSMKHRGRCLRPPWRRRRQRPWHVGFERLRIGRILERCGDRFDPRRAAISTASAVAGQAEDKCRRQLLLCRSGPRHESPGRADFRQSNCEKACGRSKTLLNPIRRCRPETQFDRGLEAYARTMERAITCGAGPVHLPAPTRAARKLAPPDKDPNAGDSTGTGLGL